MARLQPYAFAFAALLAPPVQAATVAEYVNDFNQAHTPLQGLASNLGYAGWTVSGTSSVVGVRGLPAPATPQARNLVGNGFLGEFGGNDRLGLTLVDLPSGPLSIGIAFDLYLLRSWDGSDSKYSGDDIFGFGHGSTPLLRASFSNGDQPQSYCPGGGSLCDATWGSDGGLKNELGFGFGIWTEEDEQGWKPQSLVVHFPDFTMHDFAYEGDAITLFFFSQGLQIRDPQQGLPEGYDAQGTPLAFVDESWGIDNLRITVRQSDASGEGRTPAQQVPEPGGLALALAGLAALRIVRFRAAAAPA